METVHEVVRQMTAGVSREVGSDFEAVEQTWLGEPSTPPWHGASDLYVESGRQALAVLSDLLWRSGYRTLLAPDYYCESMLQPFLTQGWRIELAPVDADLRLAGDVPIVDAGSSVILSATYFGVPERPDWLEFVAKQQAAGAKIISDETHRVFGGGLARADHRFASLRKLLPVPDGAFVSGAASTRLDASGGVGELRRQAMATKTETLRDGIDRQHRQLFEQAELLTEQRARPAAMSTASRGLVVRFNYERMRARRVSNAVTLVRSIEGTGATYQVVHRDWLDVGLSHLLIRTLEAHALRRWLASHAVYCPIHWPEPGTGFPRLGPWPTNLLSIPIDQRYDDHDMRRVGDLLNEWASQTHNRR